MNPVKKSGTAALIAGGLVLLMAGGVSAQPDPDSPDHPLHALAFLTGFWSGEIDGTLGAATGERQYRFVVRDRFLLMTHARGSATEDESRDPADSDEWTLFSYDADSERVIAREFLVEGIVNRYACEVEANPWRLDCISQTSEGGGDISLRLVYEVNSSDEFAELFEVVGPDGNAQLRMEGRWRRRPDPIGPPSSTASKSRAIRANRVSSQS